jgi:hypothetical protein
MQQQTSQSGGPAGAASEIRSDAQQIGSTAANRVHSEVDARKGTAAQQARSVSSAIQRTAGELDESVPAWLKSTFQQGAEQIQRFADTLEQRDSRELVREVETFARNRPGAFLLACAGAGFAAARLFKAGNEGPGGPPQFEPASSTIGSGSFQSDAPQPPTVASPRGEFV